MNNRNLTQLEEEYRALSPLAAQFAQSIKEQLHRLLAEQKIHLGCPVESRIKMWQSLSDKLDRKSISLSSLKELNDLIGLRLILLFQRDVASTCKIIESQFTIVASEDTAKRLREEQFGYSSVHYVVELPNAWLNVPTLKSFGGFKAEIQVRTMAQHIWAAASHTLQYKHEEGVPPPLRRTIHRASALLEIIDLEFERVLSEKEAYKETLSGASEADLLNVDSLEKILDEVLPPKNKSEVEPETFSELLSDLRYFELTTPDDLRKLIEKHRHAILAADRQRVEPLLPTTLRNEEYRRARRGVYFTFVGLVREALLCEFGEKWNRYLDSHYG